MTGWTDGNTRRTEWIAQWKTLGLDYRKYVILGACNPPFAHKSLEEEETIGLMLPCNVIVYEKEGKTALGIIKPTAAMQMVDNDNLRDIAMQIEEKLRRAFDAVW